MEIFPPIRQYKDASGRIYHDKIGRPTQGNNPGRLQEAKHLPEYIVTIYMCVSKIARVPCVDQSDTQTTSGHTTWWQDNRPV